MYFGLFRLFSKFHPARGQRTIYTGVSKASEQGLPQISTMAPTKRISASKGKKEPAEKAAAQSAGLRYGRRVLGKRLFRVREGHVAAHLIPLMTRRAVGAAKLDLVLRGVALQEAHAGRRDVGLVLPSYSWEQLHDLARVSTSQGATPPDIDAPPGVVRLKRKWVGNQLKQLEELQLVRRVEQPGKRPKLFVLRDDGTGEPLDDPDGQPGNTYVTILGSIIASGALAAWSTPALSAYLAAMVAERHDPAAQKRSGDRNAGEGRWFRALAWFADVDGHYGPEARIRLPFAVATLERGFRQLRRDGLVMWQTHSFDLRTMRRLSGPRNFYKNNFQNLNSDADVLEPKDYSDQLAKED